jgi:hypothetical protein
MASGKKKFSKMILTHESGSQEDQFDEKMEANNLVILSL